MADSDAGKSNTARETLDILMQISSILNTGLDADTLAICVRLCECGINPEALASVIQELRRAASSLQHPEQSSH